MPYVWLSYIAFSIRPDSDPGGSNPRAETIPRIKSGSPTPDSFDYIAETILRRGYDPGSKIHYFVFLFHETTSVTVMMEILSPLLTVTMMETQSLLLPTTMMEILSLLPTMTMIAMERGKHK